MDRTLLVVHHSRTGGARAMAEAAVQGAEGAAPGCARLVAAGECGSDALLAAAGYLFACPENLGSMSGAMKEFFDCCYYPVLGRIEGRPYAVLVCAGTDGEGAARQIARIATGWRLKAVADPLIVRTGAQEPAAILAPKRIPEADLARCREAGATLAAGISMGIF